MLLEYVQAAMRKAKYEILSDDGTFHGRIPECQGVWATRQRWKVAGASCRRCWRIGSSSARASGWSCRSSTGST